MNTDMANPPPRVVLDTNVLISSFLFGGKPRDILFKVIAQEVVGVTSQILLAELIDTLGKKFKISQSDLKLVDTEIKDNFEMVLPIESVVILQDEPDNRVLEAAFEGGCNFIITGDKGTLGLKDYKGIKILKPSEFLCQFDYFI